MDRVLEETAANLSTAVPVADINATKELASRSQLPAKCTLSALRDRTSYVVP